MNPSSSSSYLYQFSQLYGSSSLPLNPHLLIYLYKGGSKHLPLVRLRKIWRTWRIWLLSVFSTLQAFSARPRPHRNPHHLAERFQQMSTSPKLLKPPLEEKRKSPRMLLSNLWAPKPLNSHQNGVLWWRTHPLSLTLTQKTPKPLSLSVLFLFFLI